MRTDRSSFLLSRAHTPFTMGRFVESAQPRLSAGGPKLPSVSRGKYDGGLDFLFFFEAAGCLFNTG